MDWFSEPLKEIFGIPSFWIARLAKTIQFLAGTVIVIEIIGKERIGELADIVRARLLKIAKAEPLKAAARDLLNLGKYSFLSLTTLNEEKSAEYTEKASESKAAVPAVMLSMGVACLTTTVYFLFQPRWGLELGIIWKLPLILFGSLFITMLFTSLILPYLILLPIYIILRPIEIVFDGFAKSLSSFMAKEKVVRRLLIVSLGLLLVSFFFDLMAS